MKTNIKKIVLGLGGAASVIAPIATAVSCNGGGAGAGKWEGKNDGKYSIMSSFSSTGVQQLGLKAVINLWNETHSDKKIDIAGVEGGYSSIAPQLANEFEANDTAKMPNMIIDYPDTIGTIAKYDAQLDLDDENGTIKNLFNESFTKINDQIGGVESGKLFALPVSKSVDMASYNAPVFKVIIDLARQQGLFETDATKTKEVDKILKKAGTSDQSTVEKIWVKKAQLPTFTTKFGDEILTDSSKMLDFITQAATMFDQSKNPTGAIFGIDSATNFIYSSVFQKAGGDFSKFLFSKGADGYIHYNWDDKNSDGYKIFEEVYGKLQKAIDAGAVYVNTGGAYSSSLETQHKIAFDFGSTAGYSYHYVGAAVGSKATIAKDVNGGDVILKSYTDKLDQSKADADIIGTYYYFKKDNQIILSTSSKAPQGANEFKLKDAAQDNEVKDFIQKNKGQTLYVSSASNIGEVADKVEIGISGKYTKYLTVATEGTVTSADDPKTLQENELYVRPVATTYDGGKPATLVQGPSIIGIHNSTEDAVVKEFVKWFMTEKIAANDLQKAYNQAMVDVDKKTSKTIKEEMTPSEFFDEIANYTLPTTTSLAKANTGTTPAAQVTLDALKEISSGSALAFDNPADDTTGNFRNVLQSTIAAQYTSHVNHNDAIDAKDIYEAVKHSVKN